VQSRSGRSPRLQTLPQLTAVSGVRPSVYLSIIITKWLPGGFRVIFHAEGRRSLYRGTSLALFGVSNGALQFITFMGYEKMKG
jgi:hypothetical protein